MKSKMRFPRGGGWVAVGLALALSGALVAPVACSSQPAPASALQIKSREQLIGGRRALGEVGDFKLTNGIIQVVIQDVGHSRGFGAFGGSLIDIDLVRSGKRDSATGPRGNDQFTEMFPAFFLEAMEPNKVEVLEDGRTGDRAVVRVSGEGNQFLSMAMAINEIVLANAKLSYQVDYILERGKQYLTAEVTVFNRSEDKTAQFPVEVPTGFITLLGAGQKLFVPGKAGFDMRFRLEEVYKQPAGLNALPGEVAQMVATEGQGTSYALAAAAVGSNYLMGKPTFYPDATRDSMLIPLAYSSFLGTFWGRLPPALAPGKSFTFAAHLAVGAGDVASAQKVIYDLKEQKVAQISGRIREEQTLVPVDGVSVVLQDEEGNYLAAARTRDGGRYQAWVPPGRYRAIAVGEARRAAVGEEYVELGTAGQVESASRATLTNRPGRQWRQDQWKGFFVEIVEGKGVGQRRRISENTANVLTVEPEWDEGEVPASGSSFVICTQTCAANLDLQVERPALLSVRVTDEKGRPLPAKVSVEAIYPEQEEGALPWNHLYDLRVGEKVRQTDLVPGTAERASRRYLETHFFVSDGRGGTKLRPNLPGEKYTVHVSRGIEYGLASVEVELGPGEQKQVSVVLEHLMPTPGWVSADFHVHSEHSVDSNMDLEERVLSYAAEGVDYLASTDHNYVSDFGPTVEALGLSDWVATSVGLELTTLEMGHFNAWPLQYDRGPVTHGAFDWFRRGPGDLFAQVRKIAKHGPDKVLIQVNHPRDTIMGYFNAFNVSSYLVRPLPPPNAFSLDQTARPGEETGPYRYDNFSWDFNVLEVFNGKRQDLLRHYRIPQVPPPGPEPSVKLPAPGQVLLEQMSLHPDKSCPWEPPVTDTENCVLQPKFPGALEDWYAMLSAGRKVTGVGNSDSHDDEDEAGLPRSYLWVGKSADGSMRAFDELAGVEAVQHQRVSVTNGPFVELEVNGQPVGSRVVAPDGAVSVRIKVQAVPWVDVSEVTLLRGGKDRLADREFEMKVLQQWDRTAMKEGLVRFEQTVELSGIPDGSFLVVEVRGEESMWPVFTPREIPSIAVGEAVWAIGSAFGYVDRYGKYQPQQVQAVTPFAFTNPVFIDHAMSQALMKPLRSLPLGPSPGSEDREPRRIPDLRKLLGAFHGM